MSSVRIEKTVYGGYGLGRGSEGVVLIPGVARGELVEYADDGARGGVRVGRVVKIIETSPERRDPPCVHAGECGGCDWLFMSYNEQIRCKKEIFLDCADRIGKFERPDDVYVFSADEFGYRMRAQVKIDRQNKRAGFFRRKTNDVVRVDKCPLLADEINGVLKRLNSDADMIDAIPENINVIKILSGKNVASYPAIDGLTDADTEIDVGGVTFMADGGSFFQSNKFLLETMGRWFVSGDPGNETRPPVIETPIKHCAMSPPKPHAGKYCLDLYGGIGFFSLMLSDVFEKVTLVENVPEQVRAAERNFRRNRKNHINAVLADIDRIGSFGDLARPRKPDCIIVDPPRPGLTKNARKLLIDAASPVILYVSCNPSTFARDAGALVSGGYRLTRWALFDLYPNTHHIESAAVFTGNC